VYDYFDLKSADKHLRVNNTSWFQDSVKTIFDLSRFNFELEYFDHPLVILNIILGKETDKK